jgi:[acyl-carrier-protein] S-malonyltransferase
MGRDLFERFVVARELFERADDTLGRALSKLCFDGPEGELNQTANAQPAIYVMSLACLAAAREVEAIDSEPSFVAGHSLGEYAALAAAGALEFEAGLRLVEQRGRLTQAAADERHGAMAALLGLDDDAARTLCSDTATEVCNFNAPGQVVIGGDVDAVDRACALALERGARRAIPLDVTGAFHTSLMQPAVEPFVRAVSSAGLRAPAVPFVSNKTAGSMSGPAEIAEALVYQLTHPVRWVECIRYLAANGVSRVVEFGPGRVLTGLIKRIEPALALRNINSAASLDG